MPRYDVLASAELLSKNVPSGIAEQPLSLEETTHGAQNWYSHQKPRITRKEYTKQAIMMALLQLEWNNLFATNVR